MMPSDRERVIVGRITGLYGVRGWVHVHSYTDPRENILEYMPWQLSLKGDWRERTVESARVHGKGVVAKLQGCEDRDQAAVYVGAEIAVARSRLPAPAADEYYWTDLVGLRVISTHGEEFGVVDHLLETGANDVLVVKGERDRLIPYISGEVVTRVDLDQGVLEVDWDADF
jgi:16S rRNA processing protein RimM